MSNAKVRDFTNKISPKIGKSISITREKIKFRLIEKISIHELLITIIPQIPTNTIWIDYWLNIQFNIWNKHKLCIIYLNKTSSCTHVNMLLKIIKHHFNLKNVSDVRTNNNNVFKIIKQKKKIGIILKFFYASKIILRLYISYSLKFISCF